MEAVAEAKTLQEAIIYFSQPENCRTYLVARRWPTGITCPKCGSVNVTFYEKYNRWHCRDGHAAPQFTLKTGTIMEDSPIGLDKWMTAMWQIVNCKNGISSYEVHRAIGITQKSAWFMDHRIRLALGLEPADKLSGEVEVDETFTGGKARNTHKDVRARRITGTGGTDKTVVMGILERGDDVTGTTSKVRTTVVSSRKKKHLHVEVKKHVEAGSALYSDALKSYGGLDDFEHQVIDHAVACVSSRVHTNGLENFWSLFKRGFNGTYVSIEPFHTFRYLDEQSFRFNNRKLTDSERFDFAVEGIVGKRLTFGQLTGKEGSSEPTFSDRA